MTQQHSITIEAVVAEHVDAFNAHDRARLLAGLHPHVIWATGADTFRGRQAMAEVFDDGLWTMRPSLTVVDLVAVNGRAAAQCVETLVVSDQQQAYAIAVFFQVASGLIRSVKVYREGSADIA